MKADEKHCKDLFALLIEKYVTNIVAYTVPSGFPKVYGACKRVFTYMRNASDQEKNELTELTKMQTEAENRLVLRSVVVPDFMKWSTS